MRMPMMSQLYRGPLKPLPGLLNRRLPTPLLNPHPMSPWQLKVLLQLQGLVQLLQAWQ